MALLAKVRVVNGSRFSGLPVKPARWHQTQHVRPTGASLTTLNPVALNHNLPNLRNHSYCLPNSSQPGFSSPVYGLSSAGFWLDSIENLKASMHVVYRMNDATNRETDSE